ncbi:DHS-like NAD/FAD-binding domain-containing protein [Dichotomocladium elegans]|nr:DHS-like NAD/FAD-binding domain-containing protein [Dichotomocladium elegans]
MVRIVITDLEDIIEQTIAEIAAHVNKSRKALVITGAGISCNGGIPDFRSAHGLYNLSKQQHPNGVMKGSELFDARIFRDADRTRNFYKFMAELKSLVRSAKPTPTHNFIRQLQTEGRLLRLYTQNIDDLEAALDLPVVQLHGTLGHVKCMLCAASFQFTREFQNKFREGEAPSCPSCVATGEQRMLLGKRPLAVGVLRPDIVLYNEDHPDGDSIGLQQSNDIKRNPDLLIVLGTSLRIPALKKFIKLAARTVRAHRHGITVLVNKTAPTKEWDTVFDYQVVGDADVWVRLTESKLRDKAAISAAWALIQQKKRRLDKDIHRS